jgi:hypothetical protein
VNPDKGFIDNDQYCCFAIVTLRTFEENRQVLTHTLTLMKGLLTLSNRVTQHDDVNAIDRQSALRGVIRSSIHCSMGFLSPPFSNNSAFSAQR